MKLAALAKKLRALPAEVTRTVLERASDALTDLAKETFAAHETPYGVEWKQGAKGQTVTLVKTGALARFIRFVVIGTKLKVTLGVPYAKYQIGKRPVLPGKKLPPIYRKTLNDLAKQAIKDSLNAT